MPRSGKISCLRFSGSTGSAHRTPRPVPPTAPKPSARDLRRTFARFVEHRVSKRHLRRGELPHLWRILPLVLLERLIGRVLVLKAKKPISIARTQPQEDSGRLAA